MKPGPRQKLSDYARKGNKQVANARLNKNRIYIGDQWIGGQGLKPSLVWKQSFEVAKVLLDRLVNFEIHLIYIDYHND